MILSSLKYEDNRSSRLRPTHNFTEISINMNELVFNDYNLTAEIDRVLNWVSDRPRYVFAFKNKTRRKIIPQILLAFYRRAILNIIISLKSSLPNWLVVLIIKILLILFYRFNTNFYVNTYKIIYNWKRYVTLRWKI